MQYSRAEYPFVRLERRDKNDDYQPEYLTPGTAFDIIEAFYQLEVLAEQKGQYRQKTDDLDNPVTDEERSYGAQYIAADMDEFPAEFTPQQLSPEQELGNQYDAGSQADHYYQGSH
jgi:hypothetical protein